MVQKQTSSTASKQETDQTIDPSNLSPEDMDNKTCTSAPQPVEFEVPNYPDDKIYDKIESEEHVRIEEKFCMAARIADQEHEKSIMAATSILAQAKADYDIAKNKYDNDQALLKTEINIAKEGLDLQYRQCIKNSLPKNCRPMKDKDGNYNLSEDKRAICVATFKQSEAKINKDFQDKIQKIELEKMNADRAMKKAQDEHDSALCIADSVKLVSLADAQVERRNELKQALEALCKR